MRYEIFSLIVLGSVGFSVEISRLSTRDFIGIFFLIMATSCGKFCHMQYVGPCGKSVTVGRLVKRQARRMFRVLY